MSGTIAWSAKVPLAAQAKVSDVVPAWITAVLPDASNLGQPDRFKVLFVGGCSCSLASECVQS